MPKPVKRETSTLMASMENARTSRLDKMNDGAIDAFAQMRLPAGEEVCAEEQGAHSRRSSAELLVPELAAIPELCRVIGLQRTASLAGKRSLDFSIEAYAYGDDGMGEQLKTTGGDSFFVFIRGASRVRARVSDNGDGTYSAQWRPTTSGVYHISVSLFGQQVRGSPYACTVHDNAPYAPRCEVRGEALNLITARTSSCFEVLFKDRSQRVAPAVELDVFVVPQPNADGSGGSAYSSELNAHWLAAGPQASRYQPTAWELATPPPQKSVSDERAGDERKGGNGYQQRKGGGKAHKAKVPRGRESRESQTKGPVGGMAPPADTGSDAGASEENTPAAAWEREREEEGYGSADDELLSPHDKQTMRRRVLPIQVICDRQLLVREGVSLRSEPIAQLWPDQMATVIEERLTNDGDVRACVTFEYRTRPLSPRGHSRPSSPVLAAASNAVDAAGGEVHGDEIDGDRHASTPVVTSGLTSGPAGSAQQSAPGITTSAEPTQLSRTATGLVREVFGKKKKDAVTTDGLARLSAAAEGSLPAEEEVDATPTRALFPEDPEDAADGPADADSASPSPGGGQSNDVPTGDDQAPAPVEEGSMAIKESMPGVMLTGWVTLRKGGRKLVTSKVCIEPWVRQRAALLWKLQQLNDKLQLDLQTEAAMLDPTGVAFAFGGILPGHLHSKGQMHEVHRVYYSIGKVGRYLLHVRLRHDRRPVPGSPFALIVIPGSAHHTTTRLHPPRTPMVGEIGLQPTDGISLIIKTSDRSGNTCAKGGAQVSLLMGDHGKGNLEGNVKSTVTDQGDGSYLLMWQSKAVTKGKIDARVMINGHNVQGSPMKLHMISTHPEKARTELDGNGLKQAIAGKPTQICIKFFDTYGNPCHPMANFQIGLSLSKEKIKQKVGDLPAHDYYSGEWGELHTGVYTLTYMVKEAGHFDAFVWTEGAGGPSAGYMTVHAPGQAVEENEEPPVLREILPGSPFALQVSPGEPTPKMSYVDGVSLESKRADKHAPASKDAKASKSIKEKEATSSSVSTPGPPGTAGSEVEQIIAGDTIIVRAFGVDEFGNPTLIPEASLTASIVRPDGTRVQPSIKQSRAQFEIRYEAINRGEHQVHVELDGAPINGTPVPFEVTSASPVPAQSKLVPPPNMDALTADLEQSAIVMLETCDKYGNPCSSGGLRIAGRLNLVKQNANDITILSPNNHSVVIEDLQNGSYQIKVAVLMACSVKLIVNMDKDLPGTSGELPPMALTFVKAWNAIPQSVANAVSGEEASSQAIPDDATVAVEEAAPDGKSSPTQEVVQVG